MRLCMNRLSFQEVLAKLHGASLLSRSAVGGGGESEAAAKARQDVRTCSSLPTRHNTRHNDCKGVVYVSS